MNPLEISIVPHANAELIDVALDALRGSTGIAGKARRSKHDEVRIAFNVAGKKLDYTGKIRQKIDRFVALDDFKARSSKSDAPLLICYALTEAMASYCRQLNIQFIDTAGNTYIANGDGVLVYVAGRKAQDDAVMLQPEATVTPAAIRMMFGFLANPTLMNAPYATISKAVQVSTGSIGKVFETLENRGFIGTTPSGKRLIVSPELFLSEWAIGYTSRLRPKLKKFRFSAADPAAFTREWSSELGETAQSWSWSGESAAARHTKHLRPVTYTIYMNMEADSGLLPNFVKNYGLRKDPHGPIELVQSFWNMFEIQSFPIVPLHLIYADLLGTQDPRNLSVATQIAQEVVKHVHDSSG